MSTTVVDVRDVSKRFVIRKEKSLKERIVNAGRSAKHKEDFWALRGVDLAIEAGTSIGLVGPNGSGKSTLLKTIGGIIQPTTGQVLLRGRLAALLELGAGFHPDLTGRENVHLNASILGLTSRETDRHFDEIVEFSGIEQFIDTQVKFYSSGMYVRLAFAVAVHVDPDVLLVDEVLAVGDEPFQRKCMDKIRQFQAEGRTIVLVSHSAEQVTELCTRAVVLEHGQVVEDGSPREALRRLRHDYEERIDQDIADREAREAETDAEHGVTAGTRRSRLHSVTLSAPGRDGAPLSLRPGDDLSITGSISVPEPLAGWTLGASIETPLGQVIFATDTRLLEQDLPTVDGTATFTITLPALQIAQGDYSVNVALRDASGRDVDRAARAAHFTVVTEGRTVGYLHTEPQVDVRPSTVP
ncbi:ABC transporter ATP-binding protein [Georgenia sp. H159]|uniref:ABC transporter ATP-binding protein n=1 Tax=Georgenia sp. H159 TaxID=3076115 RepID=UPI002D788191|nr:ABC transporter ATP-binding protein [Georgenia sp. H159]